MRQTPNSRNQTFFPDILSVVEAAYAVDAPPQQWAAALLHITEEIIGGGIGGFMTRFFWDGHKFSFAGNSAVAMSVPDEMLSTIIRSLTDSPPVGFLTRLSKHQGSPFCVLTSEVDPRSALKYRAELRNRGTADGVNLVGVDTDGGGFLLSLGVPATYRLRPDVRRGLRRAATHVMASIRLRDRLGQAPPLEREQKVPPVEPEAILALDGRILHAEGEAKLASARRALMRATVAIQNARTHLRADPEVGLDSWKGLVASRWTLVDGFYQHGERYVVARENRPVVVGPPKAPEAERMVLTLLSKGASTKETAYALGISDTTVRVLVMRAARRFGAKDRQQLLTFWGSGSMEARPDGNRFKDGRWHGAAAAERIRACGSDTQRLETSTNHGFVIPPST